MEKKIFGLMLVIGIVVGILGSGYVSATSIHTGTSSSVGTVEKFSSSSSSVKLMKSSKKISSTSSVVKSGSTNGFKMSNYQMTKTVSSNNIYAESHVTTTTQGNITVPQKGTTKENSSSSSSDTNSSDDNSSSHSTHISPVMEKFPPIVKIHTLNDRVIKDKPGQFEIYISNPAMSDKTLVVEYYANVPSGVALYGSMMSEDSGAGTVHGTFKLKPGESRTISMYIQGVEKGQYNVQLNLFYYYKGEKQYVKQMTYNHMFEIVDPNPKIFDQIQNGQTDINLQNGQTDINHQTTTIPTKWILITLGVLIGVIALIALSRR